MNESTPCACDMRASGLRPVSHGDGLSLSAQRSQRPAHSRAGEPSEPTPARQRADQSPELPELSSAPCFGPPTGSAAGNGEGVSLVWSATLTSKNGENRLEIANRVAPCAFFRSVATERLTSVWEAAGNGDVASLVWSATLTSKLGENRLHAQAGVSWSGPADVDVVNRVPPCEFLRSVATERLTPASVSLERLDRRCSDRCFLRPMTTKTSAPHVTIGPITATPTRR